MDNEYMPSTSPSQNHFSGKQAIDHVALRQAEGMIESAEMHGTEISGFIAAFADSLREVPVILLMFGLLLSTLPLLLGQMLSYLAILSLGLLIFKTGRSAALGWARLERMHRLVEQERYEIQHHREQEREELLELYSAKGFEGKLLDEVVDVLMADENRLLKVMVEEELSLRIECFEHPLKQALGASLGVLLSALFFLIFYGLFPFFTLFTPAFMLSSLGAWIAAYSQKNKKIDAVIWNMGFGLFAALSVYFLLTYLK
jgi:vacuolar iron transporter family protein